MAGIAAYGVYVPLFRLGEKTVGWSGRGEKAVAAFDEDSVTMAVAAVMDCMAGRDRSLVDALYFATTTAPYVEGPTAAMIATAADLRRDILTVDCANSLRSGVAALRMAADAINSGSARQVIVVASDVRVSLPGSPFEPVLGDGAAAVLLSGSDFSASIDDSYSVSDEILDVWREAGNSTIRAWEDRFNIDMGYSRILPEAVTGLLKKSGLAARDISKAVFSAPDARRHVEMAKKLGFSPAQVQDGMFGTLGNAGAAFPVMLLTVALEDARAGDRVLLAGYGNGAIATVLTVTGTMRSRKTLSKYLESKRVVSDYTKYLSWRDLLRLADPARRPPDDVPSPANIYRSRDRYIRFYGVKCRECGTPLYPPVRVCTSCHARDSFEPYRFSDRRSTLLTYSYDFIGRTKDPPVVVAYIDFEGGGRARVMMADADVSRLEPGMPLEMTFRKLYTDVREGIHDYYWKCTPVRIP